MRTSSAQRLMSRGRFFWNTAGGSAVGSYPPESNHFGAYIGGAGIALLAVRSDPGADEARVEPWLAKTEKQALRLLTEGFGDHGFFAEGHGPSHMATATAFIPFLQAARTAWLRK